MAKLTKAQRKAHAEACKILQKDALSIDEKIFVLENWHEGAEHMNGAIGAHFTPSGLARDFAIDAGGGRRVIDLCAGIGGLGFWLDLDGRAGEMVCVEVNPAYVEVGRKILPQAQWICGDVFALPDLGWFDLAISNPPFGRSAARSARQGARYTGASFEYHVMDMAADMAGRGAFIVPQSSAPFRLSGAPHYTVTRSDAISELYEQTGIEMAAGCGVDTSFYRNDWHDVAPLCEVVLCEFEEAQAYRESHPPKSTTARAVRSQHAAAHDDGRQAALFA